MKKSLFIITVAFSMALVCKSQTAELKWQKQLKGSGNDSLTILKETLDGGYALLANTTSNDGDYIGNHGLRDLYFLKLNKYGKKEWSRILGGALTEINQDDKRFYNKKGTSNLFNNFFYQTADSGYVITATSNSKDGDVVNNYGGSDIWVVKLDKFGKIEWNKNIGGSLDEQSDGIFPTRDGGYFVSGRTHSNDKDIHDNPRKGYSPLLVKLNSKGDILWEKTYPSRADNGYFDIIVLKEQTVDNGILAATSDLYLSLPTISYTSFDSVGKSAKLFDVRNEATSFFKTTDGGVFAWGTIDMASPIFQNVRYWASKINIGVLYEWEKTFGGKTGPSYLAKAFQTLDGGYILGGSSLSYDGDVKLSHSDSTNKNNDIWIVKLSTLGNIQWQKSLGGSGNESIIDIRETSDAGIEIIGETDSDDGDLKSLGNSTLSFWFVKLNSNHEISWQSIFPESNNSYEYCCQPIPQFTTDEKGFIIGGGIPTSDDLRTSNIWYGKIQICPSNTQILESSTVCKDSTVLLSSSIEGTYKWSTGDTSKSIKVAKSGNYSVTVTDAKGCIMTVNNTVAQDTFSTSIIGNSSFCFGDSTKLTASAGASYLWSNGATTPSTTAKSGSNYTVTVTNSLGCKVTAVKTVTVNPLPVITIMSTGDSCAGETANLYAAGGVKFKWSTGDTTRSLYIKQNGIYGITVTDAAGCVNKATKNVPLITVPDITGKLSFCAGGNTTLTASVSPEATGPVTYSWSSGAAVPAITVSTGGNYTVTVTNSFGCKGIVTRNIGVNSLPTVTVTQNKPFFCQGDNGLTLTAGGGEKYIWSDSTNTAVLPINSGGVYSVTVTNISGCSASKIIPVNISPKPSARFTVGTVYKGTVPFINNSDGANNYKWDFGNGKTSTDINPTVVYNAAGNYTVTLTAFSSIGCKDSTQHVVTLNSVSTRDLPHGIKVQVSPNPFNEFVVIKIDNSSNILKPFNDKIIVQDILGRVVEENELSQQENILNTRKWSEGFYLLSLKIDSQIYSIAKLVKVNQ